MGGSHGGFLAGNLVGQYPSRFKCALLRNPVMDISLMIHVSDIPDWTYVEAFGSKVSRTLLPYDAVQECAHWGSICSQFARIACQTQLWLAQLIGLLLILTEHDSVYSER